MAETIGYNDTSVHISGYGVPLSDHEVQDEELKFQDLVFEGTDKPTKSSGARKGSKLNDSRTGKRLHSALPGQNMLVAVAGQGNMQVYADELDKLRT